MAKEALDKPKTDQEMQTEEPERKPSVKDSEVMCSLLKPIRSLSVSKSVVSINILSQIDEQALVCEDLEESKRTLLPDL